MAKKKRDGKNSSYGVQFDNELQPEDILYAWHMYIKVCRDDEMGIKIEPGEAH